jgi:hypothetical protein
VSGGRVLQRHVLYLREIKSSQELAWRKSIEYVPWTPDLLECSEGDKVLSSSGNGSILG